MKKIQAVRGMNDILPAQAYLWQKAEKALEHIFTLYHYQEIRLPLLEKTELFLRSIGEITDIAEKEIYTFLDRNNESLSLRPEGTAGCARALIEHGLLYHQTQKVWYKGPMFRYERPQKGRYRQFYQIGVETFGFPDYLIEAELILIITRYFQALKLDKHIILQLNSLGSPAARLHYRHAFSAYCQTHQELLDEDSKRRLKTNPLRILDSKNPAVRILLEQAPLLSDFLDDHARNNFENLMSLLNKLNIKFELNSYLVRGLDYYTGTVFEWVTSHLGAQGTVCGGGRYDGLTQELGGEKTPAAGLAVGMDRIIELLLSQQSCSGDYKDSLLDGYFIFSTQTQRQVFILAEELRKFNLKIALDSLSGSFKSQFKRADKSGARFALIFSEDEADKNMIVCKDLRQRQKNSPVFFTLDAVNELINYLKNTMTIQNNSE